MANLLDPNNTPALEPPPGVVPNFVDPPTIVRPIIVGVSVMIVVSTLGFAARLFTKIRVMKQMQLEDYYLIIGWMLYMVFQGFDLVQTPHCLGRHQWNVSVAQMEDFLMWLNYSEFFYTFCMLFTKLAILRQIQRIFRGTTNDSVYWLSMALMAFNTLYYIITAIVVLAQCSPREKIWNPLLPGTCLDNGATVISAGGFNLGLDLLIFILPIYAILRLKITITRKLGICAIFATGLLACISSFLRLYYSVLLFMNTDVTYNAVNLSWTACLEGASALLVASFPVFPRLYQFLLDKRPANSSTRPFNRTSHSYSPGRNRRSAGTSPSIGGNPSDSTFNEDEARSRDDWVLLEEGNGHGGANAQVQSPEKHFRRPGSKSSEGWRYEEDCENRDQV